MAKHRILRVENSGMKYRLISWRAFDDENFGIQWQMDSIDEQIFTLLPSDCCDFRPSNRKKTAQFPFLMKI
jgi:hypothetical protein